MFDFDQVIGAQSAAGADQVDNRIGQPDQRRQFHRTVQFDQVDVHAFGREVFTRGQQVFGGNPQPRALANRAGVVEAGRNRHRHAAFCDLQVDRLIQALAAMLQQHILAGHAEIGGAVLHIGRDVGRADDDHVHMRIVSRQDQLARGFRIFGDLDAGSLQQRQGFFKDAAFGQGQG